jgi:hypothetical protein
MWLAQTVTKKNIKLNNVIILEDSVITIGKGTKEKYTLHWEGIIYDLPETYVDENCLKIISKDE